jgi:hypothetical protein
MDITMFIDKLTIASRQSPATGAGAEEGSTQSGQNSKDLMDTSWRDARL